MTEPKHMVFLTGFMGSGKSTIGPELARKIGYGFTDMDTVIEKSEGNSIPDIFRRHGEEYFRRVERETLRSLSKTKSRTVVALGGGVLANESSRNIVRSVGTLVYLKVSPKNVLQRVGMNGSRPMLLDSHGAVLDEARLFERVESLLKTREAYYMEADVVVDTSELTVSESVEEIASKLKGLIE